MTQGHDLKHHHPVPRQAPIVLRHRRHEMLAARLFHFCSDHFLLLPIGAAVAVVWCNAAPESYFSVALSLRFLVNDVVMAFFFALLAQEIVEAVMPHGALHSWRRWGPALLGAAGGILGASLSYLGYIYANSRLMLAQAWPVACAVDIAVAYYVLKTIFRRSALLPFVLILGIATNLFAAVIVALKGPVVATQAGGVLLALVAVGVAMLFRAWKVPTFWPYLAISGTISWWAFYWLGVHPAFAFLPIVPLLP